jgi:adenine-specific DNA-methyltransferase
MVFGQLRLDFSLMQKQDQKAELGQYMTPSSIANFMANLFTSDSLRPIHLLDPGGGKGSLTSAFINRWAMNETTCTTYEIDDKLRDSFSRTIDQYSTNYPVHSQVLPGDFIEQAVNLLKEDRSPRFTHVIMNPPYKKINSNSNHRLLLRQVGIEAVNLYSAFVSLAILLVQPKGQIVAIIPRSFCNGPYYKSFRNMILRTCSIKQLHLFESRNRAFSDDDVLQENIIVLLVKGETQNLVTISTSYDSRFSDYQQSEFPFSDIVYPDDPEKFIRFPITNNIKSFPAAFDHTLKEIGIEVCTGPVVDFRMKDYWQMEPTTESVPLIYGSHFSSGHLCWPKPGKKPNALSFVRGIDKWLMPRGYYVLVKRFSSKEERRRVVAYFLQPESLDSARIGFENHLNVFHNSKHSLEKDLARGLYIYLNSTIVDNCFRVFSGHTQVNATDLRNLKYPTYVQLECIGRMADGQKNDQSTIDKIVESIMSLRLRVNNV